MNTNDEIIEDGDINEGGDTKFVEVDGKKYVDDGTGQPKKGDNGEPVPFVENQRPPETPEARKSRLDRQVEQHKKKHPELYDTNGKKKDGKKAEEFDYGQKAYLVAMGIKDADEVALVKEVMDNTGKSLEDVLNSKYFQAEVKEMRDAKAVADATPGNGKRTGQSAQDTVQYWIQKGELPPKSNPKLRQDVVNARIKAEKSDNVFTDTPVVGK